MQDPTIAKIKGVAIWFYIIAALQVFSAYTMWSSGALDPTLAQVAMALAVVDLLIGVSFVVFGYYGAKRRSWAFVAGLLVYALRAVLQFFEFFNPIVLLIRAFLLFRMYQGLQACLAANRGARAMTAMNGAAKAPRRFEMPQAPAQAPAAPWTPPRGPQSLAMPESATEAGPGSGI